MGDARWFLPVGTWVRICDESEGVWWLTENIVNSPVSKNDISRIVWVDDGGDWSSARVVIRVETVEFLGGQRRVYVWWVGKESDMTGHVERQVRAEMVRLPARSKHVPSSAPIAFCSGRGVFSSGRSVEASRGATEQRPVRQLELIRNIHFQSFISSDLALPGSGRTSRPSMRPMKPLTPRSLVRPYSFRYSAFHNYPGVRA